MSIRFAAWAERVRGSLFFVPMLFVFGGVVLGFATVALDRIWGDTATDLPFVLTSTVDGSREVLTVVAQATITVAGIAFSVSLLVLQQASSQYSPRVVHSLFHDPFNRRVMGIVVGTFTYCLIVLRSVRSEVEDVGDAVIPHLSVALAVLFGIAAILAIVAFINHSAHSIEVSQVINRVASHSVDQVQRSWPEPDTGLPDDRPPVVPDQPGHPVLFEASGWLQQVDESALFGLVPEGGTVRLETSVGRYAVRGTPFCTLWPVPNDPAGADRGARQAARIGPNRTLNEDAGYGVRQLADVALKALSTGVNDPTTAQDAIFQMAGVLREMFARPLPPRVVHDTKGRRVVHSEPVTDDELVSLAYDEIRRQSASMPTMCVYLLESLHLLCQALEAQGEPERAVPLRAQAVLVLAGCEQAGALPTDEMAVRDFFERRFGDRTSSV
jgi:uncharacterized membrane protein